MFGHDKPTPSMEEELGSIVPSSPKIACHITRYGPSSNSSAGGSVSSNGSGGYANRHSLDKAPAEGAAAAAGKGASTASSVRSLASSRRASVTERSSTHSQGRHTRTSSVDICLGDTGSGAGTPTHASRGLYSKMLSYSRRSSTQESVSYQRSPRSPATPAYSGLHATTSPKPASAGFFSQISGKYTAKGSAGAISGDGAISPSSSTAAKQQQKGQQQMAEVVHNTTGACSSSNSRCITPTGQHRQQQHLIAAAATATAAVHSDDESVSGEPPKNVNPAATPGCVSPVPAHMVTALSMPAAAAAPSLRPAIDVAAAAAAPSVEEEYAAAKAQVAAAAAASAAAAAELAAVMASGLEDGVAAAAAAAAANRQLMRSIESLKSIPASPSGAVLSPTVAWQNSTVPVNQQQQQPEVGQQEGVGSSSSKLLNSQAAARAMATIFASGSGSTEHLLQQQHEAQQQEIEPAVGHLEQQPHAADNSNAGATSCGGSSETSRGISELFSDYSTDSFGSSIGGAFPSAGGAPAAAAAAAASSAVPAPVPASAGEVVKSGVVAGAQQEASADAATAAAVTAAAAAAAEVVEQENGKVLQDGVQTSVAAAAAASQAAANASDKGGEGHPVAGTDDSQQQQEQLLELGSRRSLEHPAAEAALAAALAVAQQILAGEQQQQKQPAAANSSCTVSHSTSRTASPEPAAAATSPVAASHKSPRGWSTPPAAAAAAAGDNPEASPATAAADASSAAAEIAAAPGSPPSSSTVAAAAAAAPAVAGLGTSISGDADCRCSMLNVTIGSAIHTGGLVHLPGSPTIPTSPLTTGAYGSALGDYKYSGDYRYPELIFRLQQFLPALKAAGTSSSDFESTWEVIKVCGGTPGGNCTGKVDKAPSWNFTENPTGSPIGICPDTFGGSASVGRSTGTPGAGCQRQQQQQQAESVVGVGDADNPSALPHELSALVASAKLAALHAGRLEKLDAEVVQLQRVLVMVGQHIKAGAQQQQLRDLVSKFPSIARRQILDAADSSSASNAATGGSNKLSIGSLLLGKFPTNSPKTAAAASGASAGGLGSKQDVEGGVVSNSPRSSSPSRTAAAAAVPVPKALTPQEAAQLISLYKVRNEPQRICYKTLKLAHNGSSGGGSDGGSSSSPRGSPRRSRSASPPARRSTPNASAGGVSCKASEQAGDIATAAAGSEGSCSKNWCNSASPACEGMYYAVSPGQDEQYQQQQQQQQQQQSLLQNNSPYSTWSGVPKGFRAMKTIPEAHKRAASAAAAARDTNSNSSSPTHHMAAAMSSSSPARKAWLSDSPLRASYEGQGSYPSSPNSYPCSPSGRLMAAAAPGSPGSPQAIQARSPDRLPGQQPGRQAWQQRSSAHAMLSKSMGSVGWSYPHRNSRLVGSSTGEGQASGGPGFGGAGSSGSSGAAGALAGSVLIDYPRARARSTSPSLGMHYLEKGPGMKSRGPGAAAAAGGMAAVRSSYSSSMHSANSSNAGVAGLKGCSSYGSGSSVCAGSVAAARQQQQPQQLLGGTVLADDPKFRAACKTFLEEHHAVLEGLPSLKPAGGSSGEGSEGSAKLVARLSPMRDADSQQIDETMNLLSATMRVYGVNLELKRLGPFLYSASGRKLRIRMLNGNLLVRTGGGYQDMVDALGKLPLTLEVPTSTPGTTGVISGITSETLGDSSSAALGDSSNAALGDINSQVSSGAEQGPQEGTTGDAEASESVVYTSPKTGAKFTVSASRAARELECSSLEDAVAVLRVGGCEVMEACVLDRAAASDEAWMAVTAQAATGDAI